MIGDFVICEMAIIRSLIDHSEVNLHYFMCLNNID